VLGKQRYLAILNNDVKLDWPIGMGSDSVMLNDLPILEKLQDIRMPALFQLTGTSTMLIGFDWSGCSVTCAKIQQYPAAWCGFRKLTMMRIYQS
jgi:hypothetical protein